MVGRLSEDEVRLGVGVESRFAPSGLEAFARRAEGLGFDELWYSEVASGGIAGTAAALLATHRITVGTGVVALPSRHPAQLAMELASLAQFRPGRLRAGVGLGVPLWMKKLGVMPPSPLSYLRDAIPAIRALIQGQQVSLRGETFRLHDVQLDHPVPGGLPIDLAAVGPRMLRLAGSVADGTLLSVLSTPSYVRWARERIAEGRASADARSGHHRVTVLVLLSVDSDASSARDRARETLAEHLSWGTNSITDHHGISHRVDELMARGGRAALVSDMPDTWIDELAVVGNPGDCARAIQRFYDAGADSVVVLPAGGNEWTMVELLAEAITDWRSVNPMVAPGGDVHGTH